MAKPEWVLCMDSATAARQFMKENFQPLTDDEARKHKGLDVWKDERGFVVCLHGGYKKSCDLDIYDRVVYSPKVVYGLDSKRRRPVYCWYECPSGMTITPKHMLQQIARTRNIVHLHFIFFRKNGCSRGDLRRAGRVCLRPAHACRLRQLGQPVHRRARDAVVSR